jgi:GT2 family glycosyltransferase
MPAEHFRYVTGAKATPSNEYDADIVLLALNRAEETLGAIASALAQRGCSFHLFVVDQGSEPKTLARFAAAIAGRKDATLVASERNLGVAGGRNLASSLGHGRIIIGLDNDAVFAGPGTAALAVAEFGAAPDIGAIGFRILAYDTGEEDLSSWGYPAALLARAGEAFDVVTFVGAGHAIRRAAWDDAEGYDAALFFCWEEYDFCLRAIEKGWRIRYQGNIAVRHHAAREARVGWSGTRRFYFIRNRLYVGHKTGSGGIALAARFAVYALRGFRHGELAQALRALPAARRLAANAPRHALSAATLAYLKRNDSGYRGGLLDKLRAEFSAKS